MRSRNQMQPGIAMAAMLLCGSIGSAQIVTPPVPVAPPVAVPAGPVVATDPVAVGPLGVRILPADRDGVRIVGALPGRPVTVLNPGDIIVDVNGRPVVSPAAVQEILREIRPGQEVTVRVLRNGVLQPVTIAIGEPAAAAMEQEERAAEFLGMFLAESATGNVVVSRVVSGSPAAAAGVLPGDILTRVEDHRVAGIPSFLDYVSTLLAAAAPGDQVDVEATRGTGLVQFRLRVPGKEVVRTTAMIPKPTVAIPSSQVVFCMEVRDYGAGRVVVLNVMEGSPAHAAGIRSGDVISSVGDRDVRSSDLLAEAVMSYDRGDRVVFGIVRGGQLRNVEVTMAPCEYVRPAPSSVDLETAAEQIRILRAQIDELQRTVEVLSYTIERAQPPAPLDRTR